MTAPVAEDIVTPKARFVQCPRCEQNLPLRSTGPELELPAVWRCSSCGNLVEGFCGQALLVRNPHLVLLHDRYFDVSGLPEIDSAERRRACELTTPIGPARQAERRRSSRSAQSFVAPAIALTPNLTPQGSPFRLTVANLSREGIGLVHPGRIDADFIAMLLGSQGSGHIQVIVRIVRHLQLEEPYFEIGGELFLRLGSISTQQHS